MFIRGSGSGQENRREDEGFYRGIVVKNNDPLKLNRVKIYIPEISNQPYDGWFEEFDKISVKAPGSNNPDDNWSDTKIYEELAGLLPWAEPVSPVIGESSNFRYYKDGEICTISDCNYPEGFQVNDTETPTLEKGSYCPAFLYENESTIMADYFVDPMDGSNCIKANPYAFSYRPSKHANKSKGLFGVPNVGSKVWVFHYGGDLNFPLYFGVYRDYRELSLINNTDNTDRIGPKYPNDFEN